ncbi:hypothetical protein [Amycolatopsis saalfeldensis]|uniref:Uncharacterized protein n=1 Tax=Amycolatopsis saalfeldensis TaxID=394193 RepID=A0A1H8YL04_9PSEU|nr:hypothetical protein [Amycolatopsis saalfeldensis]SEP52836.1 hypothetical protein SAMN04489732_122121 [Amycolatopsis saalfeldensis]
MSEFRIDGRHGSYEFDDAVFATGGGAHLFHGRGRDFGLVYQRYLTPVRNPESRRKLLSVVDVGRTVFPGRAVALGSSPQASVCWPTDVELDSAGAVTGVVLPRVPGDARPLASLRTARADLRVSVLIRVAEIFAWLSANGLAHGGLSEAGFVWREAPSPGALLIDADRLQPSHDHYNDWHALALIMYRGLPLAPESPAPLTELLHRALSNPLSEKGMVSPAEWVHALREVSRLPPAAQQPLYPPQYRPHQPAMVQPSASRSSYVVAAVVALGLLVVLVGATVTYAVSRGSATAGTAQTAGTSPSDPGYYVPDPSTTTPAPVTTTETVPATVDADPEAVLRAQAAADYPQVEALAGQWVPQLSSKAVGTQDNGITYDNAAILAHYRQLKVLRPTALLLSSADYSTFKNAGYWVIVLPQGYSSGTAANAWCDAAGIDADNCFAKLLSHTAGPQGATLNRR